MRQIGSQVVNGPPPKKGFFGTLLGLAPAIGGAALGPWGAVGGGLLSGLSGQGGLSQAIQAIPGAMSSGTSNIPPDLEPIHTAEVDVSKDSPEHGGWDGGSDEDEEFNPGATDYDYGEVADLPPQDQELYDSYVSRLEDDDPEQAEYLKRNPEIFYKLLQEIRGA